MLTTNEEDGFLNEAILFVFADDRIPEGADDFFSFTM